MKVDAMFPSKYLKAAEVEGKVFTLTIARIGFEDVGDESGSKPVIHFQGATKGMVLNRTNANTLEWLYGSETDDWVGKQVELFTEMTQYMGQPRLGMRLRGVNAAVPQPATALGQTATPNPSGAGRMTEPAPSGLPSQSAPAGPSSPGDLDDEIPF